MHDMGREAMTGVERRRCSRLWHREMGELASSKQLVRLDVDAARDGETEGLPIAALSKTDVRGVEG